jgi:hypothetical protein
MTETTLMEPIYLTYQDKRITCPNSNTRIIEAIDESLAMFGGSVKQAVYFHLEKKCNIKKYEIPDRIEEFAVAMEELFGNEARLIQIRIMEALYGRAEGFKYYPVDGNLLFEDYMQNMKIFLESEENEL